MTRLWRATIRAVNAFLELLEGKASDREHRPSWPRQVRARPHSRSYHHLHPRRDRSRSQALQHLYRSRS